ncbi:phage major capsid protein [Roseomonas sp. BN140053]|uniref:phage major capsid protein n=1 Tax=Roseomonas sp. BN140053 TaxID=3391898 RepID=UPI0039E863D1
MQHRTSVSDGAGLDFVISDGSRDRHGTRINPAGWELTNFQRNPIALFGHSSGFPIGRWENIRMEGGKLLGRLVLASKGTSARIDELVSLVEQGILRAVSVGFSVLEYGVPGKSPYDYMKQELAEVSLVSVPSNTNALARARGLNISPETLSLAFGEHADAGLGRSADGGHAELETADRKRARAGLPPLPKAPTMNTISQRVEEAQLRLVALRDQLTDHLGSIGGEPDDAAMTVTEDLNGRIAAQERTLASFKEAEARLAATSEITTRENEPRRPFAAPAAPKVPPKSYAYRAATLRVLAHVTRRPIDELRQERYGDDEPTKIITDVLTRAASAPATTATSGWASQLVTTVNADFMQDLMPASVYPGLSARGLRLNFGRAGVVNIPSRSATPTVAGSFVGEGSAIPVRQGAFSSQSLTPKKMAVISTFTREIAEHSTPAIEGLIRDAMQEDTAVAIDTVLLDATAASTIRPAGMRNGVTAITAMTGGGFTALVADVKALIGALITATNGNVRAPVWIMNPVQAVSISLTQNAGGDFPFQAELSNGLLQGYPVIQSPTVAAGMVLLVDAADFVSVTGDEPRFDVSDQATLHMEDTTPLAISATGTPNTVAAPIRSLFQTDTLAVRMILPMNWTLRRAGVVAWTQSVSW